MSNHSYSAEYPNIHPNQKNSIRSLLRLLDMLGLDKNTRYNPTFGQCNEYIFRVRQRLKSDSII